MYSPLIIKKREFLPKNLEMKRIETLQPFLHRLEEFVIDSQANFYLFLQYISEVEAVVGEAACWTQIYMTCDTSNKQFAQDFENFHTLILPVLQKFSDTIQRKIIASQFSKNLPNHFDLFIKNIKKNIAIFREDNILIHTELAILQQEYGNITSAMSVEINDKEMTLQQAAALLKEGDREIRKEAYLKIQERRYLDKEKLNNLFSQLIQKRHTIATNAGFENYASYKFLELGRYDYSANDCFNFHTGIKKHLLPLVEKIYQHKKQKLNFSSLYPWDIDAPAENEKPLKPFQTTQELLHKTIAVVENIDLYFGFCLKEMQQQNRLDLESRKAKSPGGYNCPLAETGVPFIFMNAAGTLDDVITLIHESGHAVHSFLSHDLDLSSFKEYPMEIAELASMSMELFSLENWNIFFANKQELKRAKLQQWERVLSIFPWIAMIDSYQHWLYNNPSHTENQRIEQWQQICNEYQLNAIDYSQTKQYQPYSWQKQLHLYEVPFYYIEYGIAQLGAIVMYKNYKQNKADCLLKYKKALQQGGQLTLPQLYKTAGIEFRFDEDYIKQLCLFVEQEISALHEED